MRTFLTTLAFLTTLVCPTSWAHEPNQLGMLKGEGMALYYSDHALSGHIGGLLLFATPLENEFGIKLTHRSQAKDYESIFRKTGTNFSGRIENTNSQGEKTVTEVTILKVNAAEGLVEGTLNAVPFKLIVSSNKMEGHHYVDPNFDVTLGEKKYSFHLENGMACIGCVAKITYVTLGMLKSTGIL